MPGGKFQPWCWSHVTFVGGFDPEAAGFAALRDKPGTRKTRVRDQHLIVTASRE
jgi:hypothetical protein